MGHFEKILRSFEFDGWSGLISSLMPSVKYNSITTLTLMSSSVAVVVNLLFGLEHFAFIALLISMVAELTSGVIASYYRKDKFDSTKFSRFLFKAVYYLILIYITNNMAQGFKMQGYDSAFTAFHWIHLFITIQIVAENLVSIIENVSVISGNDKTHWIVKIQSKINELFKLKKDNNGI